MRTRTTLAGAALAAAALGTTASAPESGAQPIPQMPAIGVSISGLVIPGPAVVFVHAQPASSTWQTRFSVHTDPAVCAGSAAGMLVKISYVNPGGMRTGGATLNPCPNVKVGPQFADLDTNSGQIYTTSVIVGSNYRPNAGQPSLPGFGTFRR
ncbi:MAG: hypothetical protein QM658_03725 [Gordonia sp. (in: high G+C Gram-positive bacteria)]